MEKIINKLPETIEGIGSTRNFTFKRVYESETAYIYKMEGLDNFEAFLKKTAPICLDFENRVYSETEFKEIYPKDEHWGAWAWTFKTLDAAINHLNTLTQ